MKAVHYECKNKYPIYIMSKGRYYRNNRYQAPKTIQYLESIGIKDYKVVVEEDEYAMYNKSISDDNLIILDRDAITIEDDDGGSIPARNFIHLHALAKHFSPYWILDDNIDLYHFNDRSQKIKVISPIAFKAVEDFFDSTKNVMVCGHQYSMFVPASDINKKVQYNTRVYSSILINGPDIAEEKSGEFKNGNIWRGTYNEDTDLSLRMLKAGYGTFVFNTFTANKETTNGGVKGGNHSDIYADDNNGSGKMKTEALMELHSDVCDTTERYYVDKNDHSKGKRIHHKINFDKLWEKYPVPKIELSGSINYDLEYISVDEDHDSVHKNENILLKQYNDSKKISKKIKETLREEEAYKQGVKDTLSGICDAFPELKDIISKAFQDV
jgi:hypothetical protein